MPSFFDVSFDAVFIGAWVALLALTVFERKGAARRVPIWVGISIGLLAMLVVPPLLDLATGKYQDASLRGDVNHCTNGMLGQAAPTAITNICDHSIVVGLCLPDEKNPEPCEQTIEIAAGGSASFDAKGNAVSSLPVNRHGLTMVACKSPHRPSRTLRVGGRGYRGVCLPAE